MFGTQEQRARLEILNESMVTLIRKHQVNLPKFEDDDYEAYENYKMAVLKKFAEIPKRWSMPMYNQLKEFFQ